MTGVESVIFSFTQLNVMVESVSFVLSDKGMPK